MTRADACVDLDDVKVLNGDLLNAHVAGLLLAREDAGGIGARAHGARVTMDGAAAVAHGGALGIVALDDAGVAFTFADAGGVHLVARSKDVSLQHVAHFELVVAVDLDFLQDTKQLSAGLGQVALLALGEVLLGGGLIAQLDSFIAVLFGGLLLNDGAGARFDDSNGNDLTGFIEDLGHADLFADDCLLFHFGTSSL